MFECSDNGNVFVVGYPYYNLDSSLRAGICYVFIKENGVWTESTRILGDDELNYYFGEYVAITGDGTLFAASAIGADINGNTSAGTVRIYG